EAVVALQDDVGCTVPTASAARLVITHDRSRTGERVKKKRGHRFPAPDRSKGILRLTDAYGRGVAQRFWE
ncbi:hypothetical protein, partial [Microbacterium sp. H6]|uniref:hypothetical protein n=1 Tax=Microbacterium sp. H6 TaxID=421122 RepID=UPI0015F119B2